jgi:hypothetical protein
VLSALFTSIGIYGILRTDMGPTPEKPIRYSLHALEKMIDRGASADEVVAAIRTGVSEPARKGRHMFRKNFPYNKLWRGRGYAVKQVAPVVVEEENSLFVVTVFVFYF